MNLNWNMNQETHCLTIALDGRIDSTNVAAAEQAILELHNANEGAQIVFDAQNLEYISSAGLRVLLKIRKMQNELIIQNVSLEIYELFEIVKLFHPGTSLEEAKREQDYAKKAFVMGLPTAIPFDVVKCGDSIGLVFELINSTTLSKFLTQNPDRFEEYGVKYANLLKQLHATKVSEDVLSSTKQLYRDRINDLKELGYFTEEEIAGLHRINDAFADDTCIIHGDFHSKNVMVMDGELVLIDMADITYGNPLYDLGSMILTHVTVSPERKADINGMPAELVDRLWKIFISVYLGTTDANVIELTMKKAGIFAALKAATALSFGPRANTEYIINYVTNMTREKLLSNVDGCVYLLNM